MTLWPQSTGIQERPPDIFDILLKSLIYLIQICSTFSWYSFNRPLISGWYPWYPLTRCIDFQQDVISWNPPSGFTVYLISRNFGATVRLFRRFISGASIFVFRSRRAPLKQPTRVKTLAVRFTNRNYEKVSGIRFLCQFFIFSWREPPFFKFRQKKVYTLNSEPVSSTLCAFTFPLDLVYSHRRGHYW